MRKEYLRGEPVETIYFGGGTPSQLAEEDFREVFETIRKYYGMEPDCGGLLYPVRLAKGVYTGAAGADAVYLPGDE